MGSRTLGLGVLTLAVAATAGACTWKIGVSGGDAGTPAKCEVARILHDNCVSCHAAQPIAGAPMPLVTSSDLHAPAQSDPSRAVFQVLQERVHLPSPQVMPPTGSLSAQELDAIDAWVAEGAPDCGFPYTGNTEPPDTHPINTTPADGCFELRAHGAQAANDTTPFRVRQGQFYHLFNFRAPNSGRVWGLRLEAIIDNPKIIHHWLLYMGGLGVDGTHSDGIGIHPAAPLLLNWEPGGKLPNMPPDVGLDLAPPGGSYELEIHYFNNTDAVVPDRSGVRICYTKQEQPNTAGQTWLGTELILVPSFSTVTVGGGCTPRNPGREDIHIVSMTPHMHQIGTHMTTVINRIDGTKDVLVDAPFSFNAQRTYRPNAVVHPGDTLTTICTFENPSVLPVTYGPSTQDEMCYNHTIAYPLNALSNPGLTLTGSSNTCFF